MRTQKATSVKLKQLKRSIRYSVDGKEWSTLYEGTEQQIRTTWKMMQAGFCNGDLANIINKYNENKGEL